MQAFIKGHAFFIGMAMLFLLLSILCRFMTGVLLKKLIREAENMSATDNKLLKQCKLKFQNCYELNAGAANGEVFVGKFMQNIRLGRCSLRLIGQLAGQFLLLSVFAEGIGACVGIVHGETLKDVLPYYLLTFLSLYLFFSVSGLVDVQGKQEALRTTVTDFLENRMTGRMESVKKDSAYLDEVEQRAADREQEAEQGTALFSDAMQGTETDAGEAESDVEDGEPVEIKPEEELGILLGEFL